MSSSLSRENNLYSLGFTKDPLHHLRKFNINNLPIIENTTKFDGLWLLNNSSKLSDVERETYTYFSNECKIRNNNYTKWYIVTLDAVLKFIEIKLTPNIVRAYLPNELTNINNEVCKAVVPSIAEELLEKEISQDKQGSHKQGSHKQGSRSHKQSSDDKQGSHICQICLAREATREAAREATSETTREDEKESNWIPTIFEQLSQIKSELIRIYRERILSVYFTKNTTEKTMYGDFTEWDLESAVNISVSPTSDYYPKC